MECDDYVKNGHGSTAVLSRGSRFGHELGAGGARALRLLGAVGARVPAGAALGGQQPGAPRSVLAHAALAPFMSTMDEISYWVHTKRAPCLMTYDRANSKKNEEAHCSKTKPQSVPSNAEVPTPKKKKKRKLSLLDDDSVSAEKQQNVYFNMSQNKKQTGMSSCKSDTMGSDIDFNIKNSLVQRKPKRSKLQKANRTTLHKKNKLVTSTPKVSQLRRSLRQAQQTHNTSAALNSSFGLINDIGINGHNENHSGIEEKSQDKTKKSTELLAGGDQSPDNKKNTATSKLNKSKNEVLNGQFEDLSDVSGFTANYIRSTKLQSTKTPRKLRCKNNRNLMKEQQSSPQKDCAMVACMDTSMNAGGHNCSMESENVINLVTKNAERSVNMNKDKSELKFIDSKPSKEGVSNNELDGNRTRAKSNLNVSFQSQGTSRYPKRYRNKSANHDETILEVNQAEKRRKISKNSSDFNNSDRKENPEATTGSRTRSGRNIGLTLRQPENSVLVLSNSTEQVSAMASLNVASPGPETKERKKKRITRYLRSKKVNDKHASLQRDSLRDKSGFSACFSDSDDDSEPLRQRKFFCA